MFKPLVLYIGLRYTRAKKRNHFVSFISLSSMIGIALGITVLITVLSVMNGFDYEIHHRILSVARHVSVMGYSGKIDSWQKAQEEIVKNKDVIGSAPFIAGQGMLSKDGRATGVMVNGILPEQEVKVSNIFNNKMDGAVTALKAGSFGIVLGQVLAKNLDVGIGDKIVLITPQITPSPLGVEPRFKRFTVVGIFNVGEGFGLDATTAFINLHDAGKLFSLGQAISGFNVKIKDLYRAPLVSAELLNSLGDEYLVSDWTYEYGSLFKAIRMEKTTMFVVLLFIIAVAVFNLVSSLVMTVNDKQSDIAILRTLGATPKMIMGIFIIQGGIIGVFGTLLGIIGGVLLAFNAPDLVILLEKIFNTHFISAWVYYIDYLPSKLEFANIWQVGLITLVMSLLATIYPAWRAAKTEPAQALRYE